MNKIQISELLTSPQYDFLKTNPHLGSNIILLTLGGSHAYGTDTKDSDLDLRGVAINKREDILRGTMSFEQVVEPETDTTIYGFMKFINLLKKSNPNMLEILGCRQEDILYVNPLGQEILDNIPIFLSKRAGRSLIGYASMQLNRLLNKSIRMQSQEIKEKRILQSTLNALENLKSQTPYKLGDIQLYIDDSLRDDLEKEIYMDIDAKKLSLRDFNRVLRATRQVVLDFEKMGFRNVKAIQHDKINKHMMHLVRLYLMGIEILKTGELHTYRKDDLDLLMEIRNGKFTDENDMPLLEFSDLCDQLNEEFQKAMKSTKLPDEVDLKRIDQLVIKINEKIV